ncbi:fosfomycin resistance glutathione transferase [Pseudomonas asuensis]|jgi:catechol 2,3-dioxygenase-like lactoylglutathione lyase family enzyme|uniref:Glutathione transferase FosA n=1 Tax=Pseudomonas asuensis TaxID=1825787 RepID=A0ABQ2GQX6_9PSED|nr:fosfomycin resistance glutathione transferase [Pseudomonas asuensis]GGM08764.1 glutathione transferase FosA [Pseudomonas asuensis]
MLTGLSHLTLAVSDLDRSVTFYETLLGCRLAARWAQGAYLEAGSLWLCLSLDPTVSRSRADYTHYAFSVAGSDFESFVTRLKAHGVKVWKDNRSEGDSFYFLDPDGHKLEVHVGDLATRLAQCRTSPYAGMQFFE